MLDGCWIYNFKRGDLFLLAITCVWRLHWSVRRGTWSRVIKTGVDFIPIFQWGIYFRLTYCGKIDYKGSFGHLSSSAH